jgi:hypothetical protein
MGCGGDSEIRARKETSAMLQGRRILPIAAHRAAGPPAPRHVVTPRRAAPYCGPSV